MTINTVKQPKQKAASVLKPKKGRASRIVDLTSEFVGTAFTIVGGVKAPAGRQRRS
jgi:hypothetical protein